MSDHPADPGRCPACKTGLVSEISLRWKGCYHVRCERCGVQSAPRATAEEARKEWSKLVRPPAPMKNILEIPAGQFGLSDLHNRSGSIGQQYWKALAELHAEELDEVRKALVELEQETEQERAWVVEVVSNIGPKMTAAELADAVLAVMNRRRKGKQPG